MDSFENQKDNFTTPAVNAPETNRPAPIDATYQLYQPSTGQSWWLQNGVNTIGRGLNNDIIIREESVSRQHAQITVEGTTLYIEDRNSSNGTYIAGEKVKNSLLMKDVLFNLGNASFVVRKPADFELDVIMETIT